MSTILGIDTTTPSGSLAVWRDGLVVAERKLVSADGLAQIVFDELRILLSDAGMRLSEVDCFAAASGPGSFTGVRVCLTVAKGLAEAEGKKSLGVSNLRAAAVVMPVVDGGDDQILRAALLDARRGDVFAAVYDGLGDLVEPEVLTKPDPWIAGLAKREYEFVVGPNVQALLHTRPERMRDAPVSLAGAIAAVAARDGAGLWRDPAALEANYVRRTDAEMHWADRQS